MLASIAAHAGLLALFGGAPRPMPNVGVPAITVDIVFGDNTAAGLASTQRAESPTDVKPVEVTRAEMAVEPEPVAPLLTEAAEPVVRTAETPQDVVLTNTVVLALPAPARLPEDLPARRAEEIHERPQAVPVPPSTAAGGMGRGGAVAGDLRYAVRFAAHLARYKRFPPDARRRGEHGSTGVDVAIDGDGRVTAVRVVRSSGFLSLDRAAEAMVWRASPFPAPPGRRPLQLSVPITYAID
jgi:protein TonB